MLLIIFGVDWLLREDKLILIAACCCRLGGCCWVFGGFFLG